MGKQSCLSPAQHSVDGTWALASAVTGRKLICSCKATKRKERNCFKNHIITFKINLGPPHITEV